MVPDILNVNMFFDGGSKSLMLMWMVIGTPGGLAVGSPPVDMEAARLLPSASGVEGAKEASEDIVPDGVEDAVDPSKEYSDTVGAGRGARRRELVDDVEFCLWMDGAESGLMPGDDGKTKTEGPESMDVLLDLGSGAPPTSNPV
jgi:hypothetical protein